MIRDGEHSFELDGEIWTADQVGEDLTLRMCSRFLGVSLDQFASEAVTVEKFIQSV
jgi:hypothetical protein